MGDCSSTSHSRYEYLAGKCTCEQGRRANAQYIARKKADYKAHTASENASYRRAGGTGKLPSLPHSGAVCHEWRGCQEKQCVEAARLRWRAADRKRRLVKWMMNKQRSHNGWQD